MNESPRQPRKTAASTSSTILVLCGAFFVLAIVFIAVAAWAGQ